MFFAAVRGGDGCRHSYLVCGVGDSIEGMEIGIEMTGMCITEGAKTFRDSTGAIKMC